MRFLRFLLCWLSCCLCLVARAHEAQPAYLEIQQTQGQLHITWKNLVQDHEASNIIPHLSGDLLKTTPIRRYTAPYYDVTEWTIPYTGSLNGREIRFDHLQQSVLTILVRINFSNGSSVLHILNAAHPSATIAAQGQSDAGTYFLLGIEHIWTGIDHLLFVLGLLLLVHNRWRLLKTITAFTLSHSLTLALAALGWLRVPAAPVEALIALSILFLAVEVMHHYRGRDGLTYKHPWLVAFIFGLLHGLGFAGALSEVGLPQNDIPKALLLFNTGIELGQIAFVVLVLTAGYGIQRLFHPLPRLARLVPVYTIGCMAAYWLIERTLAIF
jgi:hydrogenase/urease accessory protein HupE